MAPRKTKREVGPSKSRRRLSNSPVNRPLRHFVKIIFSDTLEEKKLRMPLKFARKFGDELSDIATLIVPNGQTWQVGLMKVRNQIWFDAGWHQFAEHHKIGCRYLVVFRYMGSSNFSVIIFDTTACEIQYPCGDSRSHEAPKKGDECAVQDGMENEDHIGTLGSSIPSPSSFSLKSRDFHERRSKGNSVKRHNEMRQSLARNKHRRQVASLGSPNRGEPDNETRDEMRNTDKQDEMTGYDANELREGKLDKHGMSSPDETEDKTAPKIIPGSSEKELLPKCEVDTELVTGEMFTGGLRKVSPGSATARAIHAARMFKPKNPSFMVVLRAYNFLSNFLHVPGEFSKKYMSRVSEYVELQVSDGRHWTVRVGRSRTGCLNFGRGWNEFFRENNLEKGDVCIFELIKRDVGLKVSIFSAAQNVEPVD